MKTDNRFEAQNAFIIIAVAIACVAFMLLQGCAIFGGGGERTVTSTPANRNAETWGYIHEAEDLLGMKLGGDFHWTYVAGTPYGRFYAIWCEERKEWLGGYTFHGRTFVAMYPDGHLGPQTGLHEAARAILWTHGIYTEAEQDKIMRAKGCW